MGLYFSYSARGGGQYLAKRLAGKNVSKMTYFVLT